jgi:hypothetical protein
MDLAPRQVLLQFGHLLQQVLIPLSEQSVGPLSLQLRLPNSASALPPLDRHLSALRAYTGPRARDRAARATAFVAQAIFNLPATRDLIDRLKANAALRQVRGWRTPQAAP